jgi:hypothetical protein
VRVLINEALIKTVAGHVCFTPKADVRRAAQRVRYVPLADIHARANYEQDLRSGFLLRTTSVPKWDRQFGLVRVHHEHREELGRLRLAGIGTDVLAVAGQLGEAPSGLVDRHRSFVDLTADRSLEHGRVDEGGFGMRVNRRVAAPAVFDEYALDALAGNVRQLVLVVDECHLGILRLGCIRDDTAERQGADKKRTEMRFIEPSLRLVDARSGCRL